MWFHLNDRIYSQDLQVPNEKTIGAFLFRTAFPNEERLQYGELERAKQNYLKRDEIKRMMRDVENEFKAWVKCAKSHMFDDVQEVRNNKPWVRFECDFDPFSGSEGKCQFDAKYVLRNSNRLGAVLVREQNGNIFRLEHTDLPGLFATVMFLSSVVYEFNAWSSERGQSSRCSWVSCSAGDRELPLLSLSRYKAYLFDEKVTWSSDKAKFLDDKNEYSQKDFCIMRIRTENVSHRYSSRELEYLSLYQLKSILGIW